MTPLLRRVAFGVVPLGLAGAVLTPTAAQALAPPNVPLAACTKLAVSFRNVTPTSFLVVVTGTVTQPGRVELGRKGGFSTHDFFGSSTTPANPAGTVYTVALNAPGATPGSTSTWVADCNGGTPLHAEGTVTTPQLPASPKITLIGARTITATRPGTVANPIHAVGTSSTGAPLAASCAPARLPVPLIRSQVVVTCTTVAQADGRRAVGRTTVTVLGVRHVVRPGDCLWGVARRVLAGRFGVTPSPHQVALYVRRLEAANPAARGLLHPGMVLVLP